MEHAKRVLIVPWGPVDAPLGPELAAAAASAGMPNLAFDVATDGYSGLMLFERHVYDAIGKAVQTKQFNRGSIYYYYTTQKHNNTGVHS